MGMPCSGFSPPHSAKARLAEGSPIEGRLAPPAVTSPHLTSPLSRSFFFSNPRCSTMRYTGQTRRLIVSIIKLLLNARGGVAPPLSSVRSRVSIREAGGDGGSRGRRLPKTPLWGMSRFPTNVPTQKQTIYSKNAGRGRARLGLGGAPGAQGRRGARDRARLPGRVRLGGAPGGSIG